MTLSILLLKNELTDDIVVDNSSLKSTSLSFKSELIDVIVESNSSLTLSIVSFIVELTDIIVKSNLSLDSFRDYSQLKPTESIYLFVSEIDSNVDISTKLILSTNYSVDNIIFDVIESTDNLNDVFISSILSFIVELTDVIVEINSSLTLSIVSFIVELIDDIVVFMILGSNAIL